MDANKTSEYQDFPIFLHIINRELHDAIHRQVDSKKLLFSIRAISILTNQVIFCNVSQIHEIFFRDSDAVNELIELSAIGKFVAHSDYGSFDEFRESRAEQYFHTIERHPGFYEDPCRELRNLTHGSMGGSVSTTENIERRMRMFLEENSKSSLGRTLSNNDAKILMECGDWIQKTLNSRDQKALTFDAFERTSDMPISKQREGAIRRSLTEIYIESYVNSFDSRCIWGFEEMSHFEKPKFLAGLNIRLAKYVLKETCIHERLINSPNYGRMDRMLMEGTPELAYLREEYANFSSEIDKKFINPPQWHKCNAAINAVMQKISASNVMRPGKFANSFQDSLLIAADSLRKSAKFISPDPGSKNNFATNTALFLGHSGEDINERGMVRNSMNGEILQDNSCNDEENLDKSSDRTNNMEKYARKKIVGNYGVAISVGALASFSFSIFAIHEFFDASLFQKVTVSFIISTIVGAIIYWFHPSNFYRRMSIISILSLPFGCIDYRVKFNGEIFSGNGFFEIWSSDNTMYIAGVIVCFSISMILDYLSRRTFTN